jgi:nitrate/nitrite transporter NarK
MATSILEQFLTTELHGSAEVLGLIEGLADFSSSFVKTYSGWLSDKLGRRKPLATLGYTLTGIARGACRQRKRIPLHAA